MSGRDVLVTIRERNRGRKPGAAFTHHHYEPTGFPEDELLLSRGRLFIQYTQEGEKIYIIVSIHTPYN